MRLYIIGSVDIRFYEICGYIEDYNRFFLFVMHSTRILLKFSLGDRQLFCMSKSYIDRVFSFSTQIFENIQKRHDKPISQLL